LGATLPDDDAHWTAIAGFEVLSNMQRLYRSCEAAVQNKAAFFLEKTWSLPNGREYGLMTDPPAGVRCQG